MFYNPALRTNARALAPGLDLSTIKQYDRCASRFHGFRNFNRLTFTYKVLRVVLYGHRYSALKFGHRRKWYLQIQTPRRPPYLCSAIDAYRHSLTGIITVKTSVNPS